MQDLIILRNDRSMCLIFFHNFLSTVPMTQLHRVGKFVFGLHKINFVI